MGIGGLSEMLGMGLVIQLRNAFSIPAMAVEKSSRSLTNQLVGDQAKINSGFKLMAGGASMLFLGGAIFAGFGMLIKYVLTTSNDLELLRKQIVLLSRSEPVGSHLFESMKQFSLTTPFTIDKIAEAGKSLLSFGFTADKVMGQLKLTGEWASLMKIPIEEAAWNIGKINTGGIAMAMRFLQTKGIGYKDIMEQGGPIDPKTMRTKKGADPQAFLAAVNKVIEEKFAGGMAVYMSTIPGMMTNLKDQIVYAAGDMGDVIKPFFKSLLTDIINTFQSGLVHPFAVAFGQGLLLILQSVAVVLAPFAKFVIWVMSLAKEHPNVIKFGVAALFLGATLLSLTGVFMLLAGAWQVLSYLWASAEFATLIAGFVAALPVILAVAAAAVLFGIMWANNLGNVRTRIEGWWGTIRAVLQGLIALITTLHGGVGQMSKGMYDELKKDGLLGTVITLYMAFYRLWSFLKGFWEGIKLVANVVAELASVVVGPILWGFGVLCSVISDILGLFGITVNLMGSNKWKAFGDTIGVIVGVLVVVKAATLAWGIVTAIVGGMTGLVNAIFITLEGTLWLWNTAVKAATAVQWLFNLALDANPIGLVALGISVLLFLLAELYVHMDQITNWFKTLPAWGKVLMVTFAVFSGPIVWAMILWMKWKDIKSWFATLPMFFLSIWDTIFNYAMDKFAAMIAFFEKALASFKGWVSNSGNGPDVPTPSTQLTPAQMDAILGPGRSKESKLNNAAPAPVLIPQFAGPNSLPPIHVHTAIHLDGKVMAKVITKHQQDTHNKGGQ